MAVYHIPLSPLDLKKFRRVWQAKKGKTIKFDQLLGIKSKLDKKEYVSKSTIFCLASLELQKVVLTPVTRIEM